MFNVLKKEKGIILFIVLGTILLAVLLANAILSIVSSHSRLTQHQVSRIQAYYAAQAGVNLAMYHLRKGDDPSWIPAVSPPGLITKTMCSSGCDVVEQEMSPSIKQVSIKIARLGYSSCSSTPNSMPYCVSATTDYLK